MISTPLCRIVFMLDEYRKPKHQLRVNRDVALKWQMGAQEVEIRDKHGDGGNSAHAGTVAIGVYACTLREQA